MDKTLNELVAKYKQYEADSKLDLDNWDPRTRGGMATRKNMAIQSLDEVKERYFIEVRKRAIAIFPQGPGPTPDSVNEFVRLAHEELKEAGGVIAISADKLYEDLANEALESMSGGRFTPNEYAGIMFRLRDIALTRLHIPEFQRPDMGGLMMRPSDRAQITLLLKRALIAGNGYLLARLYLEDEVARQALPRGYTEPVVPVIVTGATPEDVEGYKSMFSGRPSFVVELNDDTKVDREFVLETLSRIKKKLEPKKPKKNESVKNDLIEEGVKGTA